jgi:hypothetical protein
MSVANEDVGGKPGYVCHGAFGLNGLDGYADFDPSRAVPRLFR